MRGAFGQCTGHLPDRVDLLFSENVIFECVLLAGLPQYERCAI